MVMTVLVLAYIFIFSKDLMIVCMFNLLAFNTILFFFRSRSLVFYITFEFSLVPMVILLSEYSVSLSLNCCCSCLLVSSSCQLVEDESVTWLVLHGHQIGSVLDFFVSLFFCCFSSSIYFFS